MSEDISVSELIKDASSLAIRAIQFDTNSKYPVSIYFFRESICLLERAKAYLVESKDDIDPSKYKKRLDNIQTIQSKITTYEEKISSLEKAIKNKEEEELKNTQKNRKSQHEILYERAYFLVKQALTEDEIGNEIEAVQLYTQVVEMCLEAKKSTAPIEPRMAEKLTSVVKLALSRAESLKGISSNSQAGTSKTNVQSLKDLSHLSLEDDMKPITNLALAAKVPQSLDSTKMYSEDEKRVLLKTSMINSREFVPFMAIDLKERFAFPLPFSDSSGLLKLSPKQIKNFKEWSRPDALWQNPKMIICIDEYSIKQTVVSDCSFVASLAIAALYEKNHKKKIITSIIYPQDRYGEPVYNPCGKYMIKLNLNGVKRKIVIDDRLPVGKYGELLCSHSSNKGELWVSLLEKAYMKVMGGYDFPGSNSNIDLHALTGWIPERVAIRPTDKTTTFDKDAIFQKLLERNGTDVLVTVATGDMDEKEAERAGLVPTHAYAVLDVKLVEGVKLFKVKNPWSHLRWKGNYSELDTVHWTPTLRRILNYDPSSAASFDNGVFWIDYDSICKFFDVFYFNWNPDLFNCTYCIHKTWGAGLGPVKDVFNIGDNPQYCLTMKSTGSSVAWVLLTRHITDLEDFKINREYITVLVYNNDGKRVYYPENVMIDGVRINSPHYLCKIMLKEPQTKKFTLVVSQYEKMHTIHYTLRVYASCPSTLKEIPKEYQYQKKVTGEWRGKSAGGCKNHPQTYMNNPTYQIKLKTRDNNNTVIIDIKAPKVYNIGFDVLCTNTSDVKAPGAFNQKSTGDYRPGFVIMELENVPTGIYNIIPSTFLPGQEGNFFLNVQASCDFSMQLLPSI